MTTPSPLHILVFGAGAVGSMLGGFLSIAGHRVALLGRPRHINTLREKGLTIRGIWGTHQAERFDLYTDIGEIKVSDAPFDLILLTVKSFDTEEAVRALVPLMGKQTVLLPFQNGLGNIEIISRYVRPERCLIGRIITGVDLALGVVNITVSADDLVVGALPGTIPIVNPKYVAGWFSEAGVKARAVPDILKPIWAKVIYNCALNGPCSLLNIPYGRMLDTSERLEQMKRIVHECYAVAAKKKVELEPKTAEEYLSLLTTELVPRTAEHYPSMLQDLRKGRRTEIDALNGAMVRMGKEFAVPTPENEGILGEIRRREKGR